MFFNENNKKILNSEIYISAINFNLILYTTHIKYKYTVMAYLKVALSIYSLYHLNIVLTYNIYHLFINMANIIKFKNYLQL